MRKDSVAHLEQVLRQIDEGIQVTASLDLESTTRLLEMAKLDLMCHIHGISDSEIEAFAQALSSNALAKPTIPVIRSRTGGRTTRH